MLHPIPYGEENYFDGNNQLIRQEIQNGVKYFQEKNRDLYVLAEICVEDDPRNTLGNAIAEFWNPPEYSSEITDLLFRVQEDGYMALQYIGKCAERDPNVIESILDKVEESDAYGDKILVELYMIEARNCLDENRVPRIQNAHDKYKRAFWHRTFISFPGRERWVLQECKNYGTAESFIELLYFTYEQKAIRKEELYDYLDGVEVMDLSTVNDSTGYQLGELLKPVQELVISVDEIRAMRIAGIEMVFYGVLEWDKMKCFRYYLQKSPDVFLQMVEVLYGEDNKPVKDRRREDDIRVRNVYNLFSKAQFCPGENNGLVKKEDLFRWVIEFHKGLQEKNRESLFGYLLGRILAYSPEGEDGYEPAEAVRDGIEQWYSEDLIRSYVTATYNKRGVYTLTEGEGERKLAERYKRNEEHLILKWPHTAQIYHRLYQTYLHEAERERTEAEHEG